MAFAVDFMTQLSRPAVVVAAVAVMAGAGVMAPASPNASADPIVVTSEEIAWSDTNGQSQVCDAFAANPTTDGFQQIIVRLIDSGWDQMAAAHIFGYSIGTYCPEQMGAFSVVMHELS